MNSLFCSGAENTNQGEAVHLIAINETDSLLGFIFSVFLNQLKAFKASHSRIFFFGPRFFFFFFLILFAKTNKKESRTIYC